MNEEQQAIINFMGQMYGQAKQFDGQMVQQTSTLRPTGHIVEQVIRNQLAHPSVAVIPPTPEEFAASGVGDSSGQAPPSYEVCIGDPIPNTERHDQVVLVPDDIDGFFQSRPSYSNNSFEISNKLDIIIVELQKLNKAFALLVQDDTTD